MGDSTRIQMWSRTGILLNCLLRPGSMKDDHREVHRQLPLRLTAGGR